MYFPRLDMFPTFLRELISSPTLQREPEPSLVMEESEEVKAFTEGGRASNLGAAYLFINSYASQAIHGCRNVIDLGCGPGTLLCEIARANPSVQFTGVDLSETMLAEGKKNIKLYGVNNVKFVQADMTKLDMFQDQSFDGVMSCFALHHLPRKNDLVSCVKEMKRLLSPQGSLFIFDFTRLKSLYSVIHMTYAGSEKDPYLLNLDRERSMRAAFTEKELVELAKKTFGDRISTFSTFKVPMFTIIQTDPQSPVPNTLKEHFVDARAKLNNHDRQVVDDLRFFFTLGGLKNDLFGSFVPLADQMAKLRMLDFVEVPSLRALHTSYFNRLAGAFGIIVQIAFYALGLRLAKIFDSQNRETHETRFSKHLAQIFDNGLGALKGPLMKFGQMMSYIPHNFPTEVSGALSSLQSKSLPYEGRLIRKIVEKELNQPIKQVFKEWHDVPIAAASISQLHLARLHNDKLVVVKVRYPGILKAVKTDFDIFRLFSKFFRDSWGLQNIHELINELETLITHECDFVQASNFQEEFRILFAEDPDIIIPQVYTDYSTHRVMVMDYVDGARYEEFKQSSTQEQKNKAAEIIWRKAALAIHRYGIYNADPHPGNYLFVGEKVAFIDFGFTRRFSTIFMDLWRQQSLSACAGDFEQFEEINKRLGYEVPGKKFDHRLMYNLYRDLTYMPWRFDKAFRFTKAFVNKEHESLIALHRESRGALRMPTEFVAILRLLWGHHALLADLNASGNWHRIVFPLLQEKSDPLLFNGNWRRI